MVQKFSITEVIQPTDDESLQTIVISERKHSECILIHGSPEESTYRAIKIIQALNNEDK